MEALCFERLCISNAPLPSRKLPLDYSDSAASMPNVRLLKQVHKQPNYPKRPQWELLLGKTNVFILIEPVLYD